MSSRISGVPSAAPDLSAKRLDRVALQRKQSASNGILLKKMPENSDGEAVSTPPDQFRYELSNLNERSVGLQKEISLQQTVLGGLQKLSDEVQPIADHAKNAIIVQGSLERISDILKTSKFEGKSVLTNSPHKSSNPKIEPITIAEPPKIGTYSVSILGKVENSSLSFTLNVSSLQDQKRSITTAFSPATGIIEGVELYFEEVEGQAEAQVTIEASENQSFAVPDFSNGLAKLEEKADDSERLKREADQNLRKIETTRGGVESSLKRKSVEFQSISTARENIKASESDALTVATAKDTLSQLNSKIVQEPISMSGLFKNYDSDSAKDLLD